MAVPAALGKRGCPRPVWHCSMRAAPDDRMVSDDEWAAIAHEVMHRTGLSPYGQEDEAVRWIAVRHGDDHIHLVAMLARQDGGKPSLSWERYKVRAACLAAEQRYGLRSTAPADHTAAPPGPKTRRPPAAAWTKHPGSRCGGRSPPLRRQRAASTSSSPAWTRPGCWCASGSAPATPVRSPGTRSPCQATPPQVGLASATVEEPALWGLTWQYQGALYRLCDLRLGFLVLSGCRPSPRCLVPRRNRVGRAWPGQPLPADGTAGPRSPPT